MDANDPDIRYDGSNTHNTPLGPQHDTLESGEDADDRNQAVSAVFSFTVLVTE